MPTLNRREGVALLAAGTLSACATTTGTPAPVAPQVFRHGVASGDPQTDSLVLWTRVEPSSVRETVEWIIAEDAALTQPVQRGTVTTDASRDFTVKAVPHGLQPGRRYHYGFTCRGEASPTGRTRTLPDGRVERLGIALVSCSNYAFGHFNAYGLIAEDPEIDIVLHTGDYIYEYGADGWGADTAKVLGRVHEPAGEIITLADYRTRHAQYKSDPQSQAMHAAHPFVACWDDHEVTNNPWTGGAQNHQPDEEGDWEARRAAALQAYYEWLPVRDPGTDLGRRAFWRGYRFGDLATLVTLESRHTGRHEQIDYGDWEDRITDAASRDRFMADVVNDPDRRMLSDEMHAFLGDALTASTRDGQPWRLIGNASPIARMLVPDVTPLAAKPSTFETEAARKAFAHVAWKGRWGLPFYTDTWDGYPAARERVYDLAAGAGARDLVFLTGDSHSFWINDLSDASGTPMGVELGTAGVSSPGDFVESGYGEALSAALDRHFETALPEVVWTDNFHQGYVRVVLTRETGRADFVASGDVLAPSRRSTVIRTTTLTPTGGRIALG
ncbi:alkaline phosphatase D family protein [uncultured Algimonas sp.]|uniref:alkaline phosphatase D family protein n=1 Tax=uncultured Algimonas sp. TaxID=1547920 RepID=UPI002635FE62|nr:alkaline phosphatase D family protein [uncultured Algimonas sp.]